MTNATDGVSTLQVPSPAGRGWALYPVAAAFVETDCPHCGGVQALQIGLAPDVKWFRCASCRKGFVDNEGEVAPATRPMREPEGLPALDATIWAEVRACLGVGANAAAVMLCRKLLFHVAVENGLPAKNDQDRAPSFAEAVSHLQDDGLITKRMRPWVERIKDVGNEANHELAPISRELALDVATFTEQLLVLAYELDALMANPELAE